MDIIKKINKSGNIWEVIHDLDEDELVDAIKVSAESYYNTSTPLLSDEVYDILVERLKIINPDSPILNQTGAPIKGKKVKLPFWMGSMNKIKSDDNLIAKWTHDNHGPYVISDKVDGVSCLVVLQNNNISMYTRGDGSYGQNISHLINYVNITVEKLINKSESESLKIAIRGESIMSKQNFTKYADIMANARNMVSGIVNSKEGSINKKHAGDVDFIAYEIIEPDFEPSEQFLMLQKWGMDVVYHDIYKDINLDILSSVLQKRKAKSIYEIDGVIVTNDGPHDRIEGGNPPYSFAYKGMTPSADTKVIGIVWKPGKDGHLIPRINFKVVRLSGADLEYTSGFNARFIKKHKLGKGAIISVIRSGDTIPYIIDIIKPAKKADLPEDLDYAWDKSHVNIVLTDPDSNITVIIQRLTKFVHDIGVEYLSEGIITKLVQEGYDNIPKLMSITADELLDLPGFQETLATKIYTNLNSRLDDLNILTLMVASNCFGRGFGKRKIKKILDVYPDIVTTYNEKKRDAWTDKLFELYGFDIITIDKFLDALPTFQRFYHKISNIRTVKPYVIISNKVGIFVDQKVVFTGFRKKDWEDYIIAEGGTISTSVSGNTTLLVYNDGEESSTKYQKAKKLGITTMAKSAFAKKYKLS